MRNQKNILLFSGIILFAGLMGLVQNNANISNTKQDAARLIIKDHYTIRTVPVIRDSPTINIPLLGQVIAITTNETEETLLQFELQAQEAYSPLIELKQSIIIEPGNLTGTVVKISSAEENDLYDTIIEAEAIESQNRFPAGTFVQGVIYLKNGEPVLLIPTSSILVRNQQAFVYVEIESGKYERKSIQIDQTFGEWTSIKNGVRADEHVVVNGLFLIDAENDSL